MKLFGIEKSCVYIIESTSGHYKIGHSDDPKRRLKELKRTQGPYEYRLIYYRWLSTKDQARYTEQELHRIFATNRVNGEWFSLKAADLIGIGEGFDLIAEGYERQTR